MYYISLEIFSCITSCDWRTWTTETTARFSFLCSSTQSYTYESKSPDSGKRWFLLVEYRNYTLTNIYVSLFRILSLHNSRSHLNFAEQESRVVEACLDIWHWVGCWSHVQLLAASVSMSPGQWCCWLQLAVSSLTICPVIVSMSVNSD